MQDERASRDHTPLQSPEGSTDERDRTPVRRREQQPIEQFADEAEELRPFHSDATQQRTEVVEAMEIAEAVEPGDVANDCVSQQVLKRRSLIDIELGFERGPETQRS